MSMSSEHGIWANKTKLQNLSEGTTNFKYPS